MTGTICSVAICKSNAEHAKKSGEKISFYKFPTDIKIRKEWIRKCYKKGKFNPDNKRICSKHFTINDYEDELKSRLMNVLPKKLKNTGRYTYKIYLKIISAMILLFLAIPSLNLLPNTHSGLNKLSTSTARDTPCSLKKLQKTSVEFSGGYHKLMMIQKSKNRYLC